MHVQAWPDIRPCLLDAFQIAEYAKDAGMKAVVIKNHYLPTSDVASLVSAKVAGIDIFGGLVLNFSVGGFNPYAVETTLKMGGKVFWMPTVSSKIDNGSKGNYLTIFKNESNSIVLEEVMSILEIISNSSAVLATGHLSTEETLKLFEAAQQKGIQKFLVTHPEEASINMPLEYQKELTDRGAFIEYCFNYCTPRKSQRSIQEYVHLIKYLGPERCILSTDLGQIDNFLPSDGFRVFIQALEGYGLPSEWLHRMTVQNPYDLLYG